MTLYSNSLCTTQVGTATADATPQADVTTSALSAGAYLFYANVTVGGVTSWCSSVAVAYVYDNIAPAVPSIVLQSPASSPGSSSTPTFTIALTGGVNFDAGDVITLHEGSDCAGASVATLTGQSGTSALITRSSNMSVATVNFRAKVADGAGNSNCSTSHGTAGLRVATYQYDGSPVAANISPNALLVNTASTITLQYTDPGSNQATVCSTSALSNVTVSTACSCTAGGCTVGVCTVGVCTVGITGTADYVGAASFSYTVTANSKVSNTATATL